MFNLNEFIDDIEGDDEFNEIPVDVETFMGPGYLEQTGITLSHYQIDMIEHMTQIFRYDTLLKLYGKKEADRLQSKTVRESILMLGKGCHAPYTPVYNPKTGRWQRLDQFTNPSNAVIGINGDTTYATESFFEGYGEMVRVTTELGFTEDVFIGHKYFGYKKNQFYKRLDRGYKPEFIRVDELSVNDRVALSVNFDPVNPVEIGWEKSLVVGMWLGDGCLPQQYDSGYCHVATIDFGGDEKQALQEYLRIIESWGDDYKLLCHTKKNMVTVRHSRKMSPALFELFDEMGMMDKNRFIKEIPEPFWMASNSDVRALISGMFSTDGTVYFKRNSGNGLWIAEWCSVSEEMAYGLHKLLLRIGVPGSIRTKVPSYSYNGEKRKGATAYIITISGADRMDAFCKNVTLYDRKAERLLGHESGVQGRSDARNYKRLEGSVYWDRIKSIESIGDGDYWTITVPDGGAYMGNGIVSKNSGKDYMAEIACAYVVYKLLCMKDPAKYFGKPPEDSFDIVNVAVNAEQAQNVFFKGLTRLVKGSPWFKGKYHPRARSISFDRNITVYSGHSEVEAFEGLNTIMVILDEIAGFEHEAKTGEEGVSPAKAIYDMYNASISSRFGDNGKLALLSFPRSKGDFISSRYEEVAVDITKHAREHTFVLNPKMPADTPGNSFTIEWTIDQINGYKFDNIWALRRPSWDVNPTKAIDEYMMDFYRDTADALGRFAAEPQEAVGGFFGDHDAIDRFSSAGNAIDEDGNFYTWFNPVDDEETKYYIHVDLARKHDRCVVSMSHVEGWVQTPHGMGEEEFVPKVKVDLVKYWTPTQGRQISFVEVRNFIVDIIRRGFPIGKITFDQWQSEEMISFFNRMGIESEVLSVGLQHYMDLKVIVADGRGSAPHDDILRKELKQLFITKNGKNVDHPRTQDGSKDIADSVCGAVYNAVSLTQRPTNFKFDVFTHEDFRDPTPPKTKHPITAPKREIPDDLSRFLDLI